MRRLTMAIVSTTFTTLSASSLYAETTGVFNQTPYQVCFTPHKGRVGQNCDNLLIQKISASRTSILMQAYSFTSKPIAKALVRAANRGVTVVAVIDKSQVNARYSKVQILLDAGIPVFVDYKVAIAHNKVMVIDGQTVETGSYNFTNSAEHRNAENMLIIHSKPLAQSYTQNIMSRFNESKTVTDYCNKKKCKVHAWPKLMPGIQEKTPAYLSVPHFKDCLRAQWLNTYAMWCMPINKPDACPDKSWKMLESLNLLSCKSKNNQIGGGHDQTNI